MKPRGRIRIATDCRHYRGDVPCPPHKRRGARCRCEDYARRGARILIIKLGALGDVIRTTPILRGLRARYPNCEITWISQFPEILPEAGVDSPLPLNAETILRLLADRFELALNFDKDPAACALLARVRASRKRGFTLKDGRCHPLGAGARHKWLTGLDDELCRANRMSYPAEIFAIAGLTFNGERYWIRRAARRPGTACRR